MNRVHPRKLLHSKWTAVQPERREKHFIVTELEETDDQVVTSVTLEAVKTRRTRTLPWRELKDASRWRQGWQ